VTGERGSRLVQFFDNVPGGGLDGDTLRGERAPAVRGAERVVGFSFLVQVIPGEDVGEDAFLTLATALMRSVGHHAAHGGGAGSGTDVTRVLVASEDHSGGVWVRSSQ
jgi:hypothetical protein